MSDIDIPEQFQRMIDQLTNPEPLHPALGPFVYEDSFFGAVLKHPLVFAVPYRPEISNAWVNEVFRHKTDAVAKAYENRDWGSYLMLHERAYRADAFDEIRDLMYPDDYWHHLGWLWTDSENIRQSPELWEDFLTADVPDRHLMMSEEDRQALSEMPLIIPVYQGHTASRTDGWSWTTERKTAEWFARRFADMERDEPMLTMGVVLRDDVLAYITSRNESEIIVSPELVTYQITLSLGEPD